MSKGLTGIPAAAYIGVNAGSPPNIKMYNRAPTVNDSKNFIVGDLWLNTSPTPAVSREVWMLVALLGNFATWIKFSTGGGGTGGGNLRSDDLNISVPDAFNAINVWGGETYFGDAAYINIYTNQLDPNTLQVNLKRSINQPNTNNTATEGMYKLGSSDFMHNYGTNNTALGHGSLNLGLDPVVASDNTAIGENALHDVGNGKYLTALGSGALTNVVDSEYCIGIGFNAGSNLTNADSDDIMIGHPGVVGDLNCIRIGQGGVGPALQDKLFIPAVWEGVAEPAVATGLTLVNANGKMYVDIIAPDSVLMTDATGNPIGIKGAVGTVFTGQGLAPADPAPAFLPIQSSGGTVTISTDPITNAINLEAAGVAGLVQLTTDAGVALPLVGNIDVLGGELIETDAAVANTVTVNLERGADGQIIVGNTAAASTYRDLICSDGSLSVDFTNPAQVDITVVGIPPVGGVNALYDHALLSVPPTLNHIQIEQGPNITTVGDVPTSKITVSVTDDVDLPLGHMYCRDNVQTSAGSLEALAGHLLLPLTDGAGTMGSIKFGGTRYVHQYGTNNFFLGKTAGNNTLNVASAVGNTGTGLNNLAALTTGQYNQSHGYTNLGLATSAKFNSAYGYACLNNLLTGNYNSGFGFWAGKNYTGAEYSNLCIDNYGVALDNNVIRIGREGTGDGQHNSCYIAGIYPATAGASPKMVVCGSEGKLSTQAIPTSTGSFVTDSGTATPAAGVLTVHGGDNINTAAAGSTVTVHLDKSVIQPVTTVDGLQGVYALGVSGSYATDRFLHSWGGGLGTTGKNTYVGYASGRINALAVGLNNTAVGYQALDAYTSASSCVAVGTGALGAVEKSGANVAVGVNAGSGLTSSADVGFTGNNILLGNSAGATYTTGFRNIVVGDDSSSALGGAAEYRTMRLGFKQVWSVPAPAPHDPDPVETLTTHGTDNTYAYGIYKNTVAYSGVPVYVDHLGKLGTGGGAMFAFRQTSTLSNVTGDGTVYLVGTSGGLTLDFDNTSSVVLGGAGAPTVFTAPYSGKYVFTASITMSIPASPPVPRPVAVDPLYIFTDNLSYTFSNYMPASTTFAQYVSEIVTTVVYLDAGQNVYWGCSAGIVGQAKNISLVGSYGVAAPAPVGVKTVNATYFSGYRVS